MGLCTVRKDRINVNLVVCFDDGAAERQGALQSIVDGLGEWFPGYAVDPVPAAMLLRTPCKRACRRFVGSPAQLADVVYDRQFEAVLHNGLSEPVAEVLQDPKDIRKYRPLSRVILDENADEVGWFRTRCGTLVACRNPVYPNHWIDAEVLTTPVANLDVKTFMQRMVDAADFAVREQIFRAWQWFANAYDGDFGEGDPLAMALALSTQSWIPAVGRAMIAAETIDKYGPSDAILALATTIADDVSLGGPLLQAKQVADAFLSRRVADALGKLLPTLTPPLPWARWASRSKTLANALDRLTLAQFRHLCLQYPPTAAVARLALLLRAGKWSSADVHRARVLRRIGMAGEVSAELARIYAASDAAVRELTPAPARRLAPRACPRSPTPPPERAAPPATPPPAPQPASTHAGVARDLARRLGRDCTLIGTGAFDDAGDADVVVAVPDAASLADAYEEVRAATGLALLGTPDGLHVAVLRGEWRGVPVDVQVWRGAEGCAAEAATARALRLSARLAAEADAAMVAGVRALHAWARAADAKGHLLCRLPGVAVTCAAVVLQSKGSLAVLLGALRDALVGRAAPALDFDAAVHLHADMTPERDANGRCVCPLRVLAERENVARRMTAGTTRHLLDCFAYASMLGAGAALCERARYDAWRAETMVVCAVARARCADVLPRLHAALSRLDGHPVVDAVHVREDGDALVVLATLDASASAAAYGFRAGDELVVDGDRASVTRRGRAWPLAITRGRAPRAAATPSVADLLAAGPGVVPNVPALTVDVAACFDARAWAVDAA